MKKIFLPGMMAALAFAACTNEDLVSQQTAEAPEADFSNRPVVGMVDLNFGPQTRVSLQDGTFGIPEYTPGKDKIGARIIDVMEGSKCNGAYHAEHKYSVKEYAWSNYRYDLGADGKWTSGALMVEGNYMFYVPYNEKALYRTPLEIVFPTAQRVGKLTPVAENAKYNSNTDAVANFYADGGHTIAVGHTFVDASEDEENAGVYVTPRMTQLYAYPQITLVNDYAIKKQVPEVDANGKPTGNMVDETNEDGTIKWYPQSLKISEITLSSNEIFLNGKIKQSGLVDALRLDIEKVWDDKNKNGEEDAGEVCPAETFENWTETDPAKDQTTAWFLKNARTSDIIEWKETKIIENKKEKSLDGQVVITLDEPVVIPAGYKVSLNVVLPAEDYGKTDLSVNVCVLAVDEEGEEVKMMFKESSSFAYEGDNDVVDGIGYAVAKRYPMQEYNFPANNAKPAPKTTAGALATFRLSGTLVPYQPKTQETETEGIHNWGEFMTWLDEILDNSTPKVEGTHFQLASDHELQFTAELMAKVDEYLNDPKATLTFKSALEVVGGTAEKPLVISAAKYPSFGKLTIVSGVVELQGVIVAELVVKSGASVNLSGAATINKISEINGNVVLNGATLTAADANGITFKGTADLTNVTINGKAIFNEAATIKGGNYDDVEFKKGGSVNGAITTDDATATVSSGEVEAAAGWATVKLYGGNLKITNKDYAPTVIVGGKKNQDGLKADKNGKLTAAAEGLTLPKVTLNTSGSQLVVDENLTLTALEWKAGSVVNNAELTYNLTVPANNTYTHNADATVKGTLTNKGTINNNGKIVVVNDGEIVVGAGGFTKTEITNGTGRVNNTNQGYIKYDGSTQVIYVKTGAFSNDDAWKDLDGDAKINTLYINGKWTFDATTYESLEYNVEFRENSSLNLGKATLDFNNKNINVYANQKWTGLDADVSVITNAGNIILNQYTSGSGANAVTKAYTLETVDINMGNAYEKAITKAVAAGGTVQLTADLTLTGPLAVSAGNATVLDLNGKTIKNTVNLWDDDATEKVWSLISVDGGDLTIKGGDVIAKENDCYAVDVRNGGKVTIKDGKFVGNIHSVYCEEGEVVIEGGQFSIQQKATTMANAYAGTINCLDANYQAGTAKVTISGGEFLNFNPINNAAEGAETNFVAEGYKVLVSAVDANKSTLKDKETDSAWSEAVQTAHGDVTYKVVAE